MAFPTHLDPGNVLKQVYDGALNRLRVDAQVTANFAGAQEVIISHTDDSIRIGDGTKLATLTTVGLSNGLDVNVLNGLTGNFSPAGLKNGIKTTAIIVTDVPTKIPTTPFMDRNTISIRVWGAPTVYFGESTVTTAQGYPKKQFEEISTDIQDDVAVELYGICDTGQSCEVRVIEIA